MTISNWGGSEKNRWFKLTPHWISLIVDTCLYPLLTFVYPMITHVDLWVYNVIPRLVFSYVNTLLRVSTTFLLLGGEWFNANNKTRSFQWTCSDVPVRPQGCHCEFALTIFSSSMVQAKSWNMLFSYALHSKDFHNRSVLFTCTFDKLA